MPDTSDISNDLYEAVRAVMATAWPETTVIYEEAHANTLALAVLVGKVPYGVIGISEQHGGSGAFSPTLDGYTQMVACYYVSTFDGTLTVFRQKFNLLRRAFNASPTVNIPENVDMRTDDGLPMNALLDSKNSRIRAGRFAFDAVIGEPWIIDP